MLSRLNSPLIPRDDHLPEVFASDLCDEPQDLWLWGDWSSVQFLIVLSCIPPKYNLSSLPMNEALSGSGVITGAIKMDHSEGA